MNRNTYVGVYLYIAVVIGGARSDHGGNTLGLLDHGAHDGHGHGVGGHSVVHVGNGGHGGHGHLAGGHLGSGSHVGHSALHDGHHDSAYVDGHHGGHVGGHSGGHHGGYGIQYPHTEPKYHFAYGVEAQHAPKGGYKGGYGPGPRFGHKESRDGYGTKVISSYDLEHILVFQVVDININSTYWELFTGILSCGSA